MSKNLLRYFIEILTSLLEEANPIPPGVLDCVVHQFELYLQVGHAFRDVIAHRSHVT
jgi:hypothetical protein